MQKVTVTGVLTKNGISTLSLPLRLRAHCKTVRDRYLEGQDRKSIFWTWEDHWTHEITEAVAVWTTQILIWSGWPDTPEYMGTWAYNLLLHWMPWYSLSIWAAPKKVDEILKNKRRQKVVMEKWKVEI